MIGANLRFGSGATSNATHHGTTNKNFQCHPGGTLEAGIIFSLCALGMGANLALMALILAKRQLRRWSQGLLFHQAMVDCARAAILLPLGMSILRCQPVNKCSLVETAFLLLVTVSTVNMLTTVLNDSPVFPGDEQDDELNEMEASERGRLARRINSAPTVAPLLMDSPQCVLFGTFMIWFTSITINLGPTFLSGALAANSEVNHNTPSCPLVHGPFRHYILNVLWIIINVLCVALTLFHLHKLHRDLTKSNMQAVRVAGLVSTMISVTGSSQEAGGGGGQGSEDHRRICNYIRRMEREGVQRVKMFMVITTAYVIFWGPLFLVTLLQPGRDANALSYEMTLHVAYVHAFVNPSLFVVLHRGLRHAAIDACCWWWRCEMVWLPPEPPPSEPSTPLRPMAPQQLILPIVVTQQPTSASMHHQSGEHCGMMTTEMSLSTDPWQPSPVTPQKKLSQHNRSMQQQRYQTNIPPESPQFSSE
ncbi:uncharacterized protein LOC132196918 isoform X1 [Neocloeon triangulifer]|uniref:uncharacterized protein LOC132196918 isoform X1 n=2 Tax=Neocloeon triangulifer TaxID=2078957 RepID=UPI00286F407E|nr:uncharacterized protein LOC132196918 isoform X1 [Neocloeon triangulifer]